MGRKIEFITVPKQMEKFLQFLDKISTVIEDETNGDAKINISCIKVDENFYTVQLPPEFYWDDLTVGMLDKDDEDEIYYHVNLHNKNNKLTATISNEDMDILEKETISYLLNMNELINHYIISK